MEIWLDSLDEQSIDSAREMGILHGITTNPSIIARSGKTPEEILSVLLRLQQGPVAAQVIAEDAPTMIKQAIAFHRFSNRIIVKIPVTKEGLKAMRNLSNRNIPIIATTVFNADQVLLSAIAGASYVAPYLSRIENSGKDGREALLAMCKIIENYDFSIKILVASIRSVEQIRQCLDLGIDAVTLSSKLFNFYTKDHPLTLKNVDRFHRIWQEPSTK